MTCKTPAQEWVAHPSFQHGLLRPVSNSETLFQAFEVHEGGRITVAASVLVEFPSPTSAQELLTRLKKAWLYTRAQCPALSTRVVSTSLAGPQMLFEDVLDPSHVTKWADETCYLREIADPTGSLDVSLLEGDFEDSVLTKTDQHHFECLIASGTMTSIKRAWLRLWLDHKTMDGPSARGLLSQIRRYLALAPEKLEVDWGSEEDRRRQRRTTQPGTAALFLKKDYLNQSFDEQKAKEWATRLRLFNKETYSTLRPFTGAMTASDGAARTSTRRLSLSQDSTRRARDFCRQHSISVTPLLLSAVVIRQTLLRSSKPWPLPESACNVLMFPVDTRPSWVEAQQTTVGLYTSFAACTIRTGEILRGIQIPAALTKDEVRAAILRGAKQASETYNWCRKEVNRAQLCAHSEAYTAELQSGMMTGEVDLSTLAFFLFSDGVIGAPSLEEDANIVAQPGGLQTTMLDYDLRNTGTSTSLRTWSWRDQTVLSLTDSGLQASRAEVDEMLRAWRDDVLDVVENAGTA